MELAKALIYLAKLNGGDAVKFQFYRHDVLYKDHPEIPDASIDEYQAAELFFHGQKLGIEVFFSVFDVLGVHILDDMGVQRFKVAYSQRHNRELILAIESTGKPYMISMPEHEAVISTRIQTTFYCIPEYPAVAKRLPHGFDGLSDHSIGLGWAKEAIMRGMHVEKHFALTHDIGIDAAWSMIPSELKELSEYAKCKQPALSQ